MTLFFVFFLKYALIFYIIFFVVLFFLSRNLIRSIKEKKHAIFDLEREVTNRQVRLSIAGMSTSFLFLLGLIFLQVFIGPSLPAGLKIPTPTLNILITPTTILSMDGNIQLLVTDVGMGSGCIPGQVIINSPSPNEMISGEVIIIGTADIQNFGFYKYEFTQSDTKNWATILAGRNVVRNDELGRWDTSQLLTGDYLLQLVVTDNQGNSLPACIIPVRISNTND